MIGVLIIGIILYAAAGIVYAGVLTANADSTLNTVVSHQNSLNTSFAAINTEVTALGGNGTFSAQQTVGLVNKSVASSQTATITIDQDDASLASIQRQMNGSRWLTMIGRSGMDREVSRVDHARNALAAARTISADENSDLQFWLSLYTSLGELDTLNTQASGGDYSSAKTTLTKMQGDVGQAIQESAAPGLPPELHALMVDLQTFVSDYGKQLDAQIAQDDTTVAQLQGTVESDREKLGTYNFDKIGTDINAFYAPLIDRFNSEMSAATS